MTRLVISELASADQAFILHDLHAKAGLRIAVKYRSRFSAIYDRFIDFPRIGASRPALGSDIRIGVVSPYIVILSLSRRR